MLAISKIPRLDELPLQDGDPPFSAWGMWVDVDHGSLNYLTKQNVVNTARNEIQVGERVSLEYALANLLIVLH
jgi:hypothetical protein